jgi:ferritin-like metal-binding protein YciE
MAARESLDDLLRQEMRDLLDGETQITKALPRMARAAESGSLRAAMERHLRETEGQIERLNRAFGELGETPRRKTCQGIKGLIDEAKELMSELGTGPVLDAALIAAAQKVEHYEIAAYGTVRTYATQLGHRNVASLFEATLREEKATDQKLTGLAEGMVNPEAAEGQDVEGLPVRMARTMGTAAGRAAALAREAAQSVGLPGTRRRATKSTKNRSSASRSRKQSSRKK